MFVLTYKRIFYTKFVDKCRFVFFNTIPFGIICYLWTSLSRKVNRVGLKVCDESLLVETHMVSEAGHNSCKNRNPTLL